MLHRLLRRHGPRLYGRPCFDPDEECSRSWASDSCSACEAAAPCEACFDFPKQPPAAPPPPPSVAPKFKCACLQETFAIFGQMGTCFSPIYAACSAGEHDGHASGALRKKPTNMPFIHTHAHLDELLVNERAVPALPSALPTPAFSSLGLRPQF